MTSGLCLDSGEFIPAAELNRRIDVNKKYPTLRRAEFSLEGEECCTFEDAYAAMVPLQKRIAELEAQIAQLTESLETASSAVIMLKQRQREGWAQLASGQEPMLFVSPEQLAAHTDVTSNAGRYIPARKTARGMFTQPLYTRPEPEQSLTDELAAERERFCAAIKAADDEASDNDYMLDSDNCISVIRGTWNPQWIANNIKKKP
jgi:hypothetical protein